MMWFGVAKGDGEVTLKEDGKYAYKVVRKDDDKSEYIFHFTYQSEQVTKKVDTGALVAAEDYTGYEDWSAVFTDDGIDFGQITKADAIKMGIATDPDNYGVAMYLKVGEEKVDLSADNVKNVVRTDSDGATTDPLISGDNKYQFVHDGWGESGEYTMVYTLQDGRVIEAKINIVSFEFKDEVSFF
jgi:hypothetical protein